MEVTKPHELINYKGVTVIGYTDFPSRLPTQSSTLYSNNITKFLLSMSFNNQFYIDLNDEVIRGSIILNQGSLMWPPPPLSQQTTTTSSKFILKLNYLIIFIASSNIKKEIKKEEVNTWKETVKNVTLSTLGFGTLLALGLTTPPSKKKKNSFYLF